MWPKYSWSNYRLYVVAFTAVTFFRTSVRGWAPCWPTSSSATSSSVTTARAATPDVRKFPILSMAFCRSLKSWQSNQSRFQRHPVVGHFKTKKIKHVYAVWKLWMVSQVPYLLLQTAPYFTYGLLYWFNYFLNVPIPASFCLFSSFSLCHNNYNNKNWRTRWLFAWV